MSSQNHAADLTHQAEAPARPSLPHARFCPVLPASNRQSAETLRETSDSDPIPPGHQRACADTSGHQPDNSGHAMPAPVHRGGTPPGSLNFRGQSLCGSIVRPLLLFVHLTALRSFVVISASCGKRSYNQPPMSVLVRKCPLFPPKSAIPFQPPPAPPLTPIPSLHQSGHRPAQTPLALSRTRSPRLRPTPIPQAGGHRPQPLPPLPERPPATPRWKTMRPAVSRRPTNHQAPTPPTMAAAIATCTPYIRPPIIGPRCFLSISMRW
jgi:hypothetical protein